MTLHCRAAARGQYFFAHTVTPDGGVLVWLVAWLGQPLPWATIGEADRDVCLHLLSQDINPASLLIDCLMA